GKKIFNFDEQAKTEKEILELLKKKKINLICLAGFMRILSKNFIQSFKGQILNIHPSLLPKYKGLNTHERAITNKDRYSGCTVHFVSAKLDSGKIIIQKKVKINKKDTPRTLANKVLAEEHKLYPEAILKIISL
ncbi:phosphoribosylglycinamide formyltransferase, partial [Candidatus Pelagibacter sp.]|nr:phosphoribosylglycinamide formyltransferase [Candidatus Pelagibacter sp.]